MPYAQQTEVPIARTKAEIETALTHAGASAFGMMSQHDRAMIAFQFHGKLVRFILPLPPEQFYALSPGKLTRNQAQRVAAQAQDHRARWRALWLGIKAKLVFVDSGIRTFEQEFLADFVMPNGKTLGETAIPQLEDVVKEGRMPQLLLQ